MTKLKLTIELVPSSSWFNNVRAVLTRKQWDVLRKQVYTQAWDTCQICGGVGPKHPVECHEIWHYDDNKLIQTLVGMIALCPNCHMVKHIGYAEVSGRFALAVKHLMKINKLTKAEAGKVISEAFSKWVERSKKSWTVDISQLKDYGIDISKLKKESWIK